jgi:hypothetical protein
MKLTLTLASTILLVSTSGFAAPPLPSANNTSPLPVTQPSAAVQNHPNGHNVEAEVPKKIDPKLQAKLDAKVGDVSEEQYHKIVTEYKKYLKTVPSEVRQEIRGYRKTIVQINKAKTDLYKKLSQEAQNFLSKEREIKKKLPIHNKAAFAKDLRESDAE